MSRFDLANIFTNNLDDQGAGVQQLPLDQLVPWVGSDGRSQPFRVNPEELPGLVQSIQSIGVLSPIVVRPKGDDYEILSGHRRAEASRIAGLVSVPVVIREVGDDEAICILCDSNLNHREKLLPSEKAFAYKLKVDATKRQGERVDLTSDQLDPKLTAREKVAENAAESGAQIYRYVRLTYLIPEMLDMVDENKLSFVPAVFISYLSTDNQHALNSILARDQTSVSLAQATQMKELSAHNKLSPAEIEAIMAGRVPKRKTFVMKESELRKFFPAQASSKDIEMIIMGLLEKWSLEQKKEMER